MNLVVVVVVTAHRASRRPVEFAALPPNLVFQGNAYYSLIIEATQAATNSAFIATIGNVQKCRLATNYDADDFPTNHDAPN